MSSHHLHHVRNIAEWTPHGQPGKQLTFWGNLKLWFPFFSRATIERGPNENADAWMTHCQMKCCTNKENISLCTLRPVNTYGGVTEYLHEFWTSALGSNKQSTSRSGLINPHGKRYWYWLDRKFVGPQSHSGRCRGGGGGDLFPKTGKKSTLHGRHNHRPKQTAN
jgi:hypothetical protein